MKLKHTVLIFFVCACSAFAQPVTLFKTFGDFEKGQGEPIGELEGFLRMGVALKIRTVDNGVPRNESAVGYWGLSVGDVLFRVERTVLYRVMMASPDILYYENGQAHLTMINNDEESTTVSGHLCFVSESPTSKILHIPSGKAKAAFKDNARTAPFFKDCLKRVYYTDYETIRACVETHLKVE